MRVVYDHGIFSQQERGGISRYFIELASGMGQMDGVAVSVVAPLYMSAVLRESRLGVTGMYLPGIRWTHRLRRPVNALLGMRGVHRAGADLLHQTYYTTRRSRRIPAVVSVFDMIHERYQDLLPVQEKAVRAEKRRCIAEADQVICISGQTRRDLVEMYHVPDERLSVIHLGSSFSSDGAEDGPAPAGPYLLYVGRRQGPKNFSTLLRALEAASGRLDGHDLVCFGGGAFTGAERAQIAALQGWRGGIHHLEGDDGTLARLYRHAAALVYPSLYEGFGLPLVEAMACGCPVACSGTSCMPEVAGGAACFFEPDQPESIAAALVDVVHDTALRARLIDAGTARAALFTWDRCVRETLEVYRRCF